jgi:hypothetical protein
MQSAQRRVVPLLALPLYIVIPRITTWSLLAWNILEPSVWVKFVKGKWPRLEKIGQGMQASYMKTTFKIVCLAHVLLPQVSFITCVSSQALDCKKVTQL